MIPLGGLFIKSERPDSSEDFGAI